MHFKLDFKEKVTTCRERRVQALQLISMRIWVRHLNYFRASVSSSGKWGNIGLNNLVEK